MSKSFIFRRKISYEAIKNIEIALEKALYPISPRQEFVHSLRSKILAQPEPKAEKNDARVRNNFVVLMLSLMGVIIVLGVWIRMIISLVKKIGFNQSSRRGSRKRITPVHSAI